MELRMRRSRVTGLVTAFACHARPEVLSTQPSDVAPPAPLLVLSRVCSPGRRTRRRRTRRRPSWGLGQSTMSSNTPKQPSNQTTQARPEESATKEVRRCNGASGQAFEPTRGRGHEKRKTKKAVVDRAHQHCPAPDSLANDWGPIWLVIATKPHRGQIGAHRESASISQVLVLRLEMADNSQKDTR